MISSIRLNSMTYGLVLCRSIFFEAIERLTMGYTELFTVQLFIIRSKWSTVKIGEMVGVRKFKWVRLWCRRRSPQTWAFFQVPRSCLLPSRRWARV